MDFSGQDLEVFRNRSLAGGVDTFSFPLDLDDVHAVEMRNIDASSPGIRKSRGGTSLTATGMTYGPVMALSEFQAVSAVTELLAVTPGATYGTPAHLKLWTWDGSAGNWTLRGTLTGFTSYTAQVEITTGIDLNSITSKPHIARICTSQPVDHVFVYDGTNVGFTGVAQSQPSTGLFPTTLLLNRCFGGGQSAGSRGKVFFSIPGGFGYTGWTSTNAITFGGGTRHLPVAIRPFRNQDLIVFLADRIEALVIDDQNLDTSGTFEPYTRWSRTVVDTRIGCASHRCVVSTGEDLLFVDQYGNVRSIARTITDNSQGIKTLPVSAPIQAYIDRINPGVRHRIVAEFYDRFYIVSLPLDDADTPSHSFAYDVINQAWYGPWDGNVPALSMAVATMSASGASDTAKNPSLYLGSADTDAGRVYRAFDGTTDNGDPIVYQETTKRYYATGGQFPLGLEAPKFYRRLMDFYVATGTETMCVETRIDGQDWSILGYIDLTGDTPALPLTFPFDLGGAGVVKHIFSLEHLGQTVQDIQFRFTATCTNEIRHLGYSGTYHRKNITWQTS